MSASDARDEATFILAGLGLLLVGAALMMARSCGQESIRDEVQRAGVRSERLLQAYAACRAPEEGTFDDHAACLAFARCVVDGGAACEEATPP